MQGCRHDSVKVLRVQGHRLFVRVFLHCWVIIGHLGELAGKPAYILRARRLYHPPAMLATLYYCSIERLFHIALEFAVMEKVVHDGEVVHGGGLEADCRW